MSPGGSPRGLPCEITHLGSTPQDFRRTEIYLQFYYLLAFLFLSFFLFRLPGPDQILPGPAGRLPDPDENPTRPITKPCQTLPQILPDATRRLQNPPDPTKPCQITRPLAQTLPTQASPKYHGPHYPRSYYLFFAIILFVLCFVPGGRSSLDERSEPIRASPPIIRRYTIPPNKTYPTPTRPLPATS